MSVIRRPPSPARPTGRRLVRGPGRVLATATAAVLLLGAPATAAVLATDQPTAPSPTSSSTTVEPADAIVDSPVEAAVDPAVEATVDAPAEAAVEPTVEPLEPVADEPVADEPATGSTTGPSAEPSPGPTTDLATPESTDVPPRTPTTTSPAAEVTSEDEDIELACDSDGPQDLEIDLVRHAVIEVTWAPPIAVCGREVLGYEITADGEVEPGYYLQYSGLSWQMSADPGPHTVSVVALTTDGRSQPTSGVVVMPEPGLTWPTAPQGVTAVQTGADEVTITWSPPVVPGSSPVTGYDVGVATAGWGNGYPLGADARSSSQDGLEPGVPYYLSVAAGNESGTGPRVFVELELTEWEAPSVPRAVVASQSGPGEVTVAWTEPADAGSSPVSGYRVEVTGDGVAGGLGTVATAATPAGPAVEHPADARRVTVTGLGAGSHVVRVSAVNAAGPSEVASVQVTVVPQVITPEEPIGDPTGDGTAGSPGVSGRPVDRSTAQGLTGDRLARTGADAGVVALGALLTVGLGAGLLVSSRRRPVGSR